MQTESHSYSRPLTPLLEIRHGIQSNTHVLRIELTFGTAIMTSAVPEVRGTADVGAYSPFRSILLVLTHDFIIICVYGPTGSDGHERVIPKRTLVAHHFRCRLWQWGWCKSRAPYDHLIRPPTQTTNG